MSERLRLWKRNAEIVLGLRESAGIKLKTREKFILWLLPKLGNEEEVASLIFWNQNTFFIKNTPLFMAKKFMPVFILLIANSCRRENFGKSFSLVASCKKWKKWRSSLDRFSYFLLTIWKNCKQILFREKSLFRNDEIHLHKVASRVFLYSHSGTAEETGLPEQKVYFFVS